MAVKVTGTNKGVRLIDPNEDGTNVNQEDLFVYVRLLARTKSRSMVQKTDDKIIQLEQELKNVPSRTNFTYPAGSDKITTNWTDIGGGSILGQDKEGFGITSIDVDIKSSFVPQVTINFVDIRGATLFEQGPCSQYASFFHMPYPVFELTVKGFYGKPVTYTLALRQFTTKFNSSTGNFEVKAEFIGYTYAFLADLLMGYALAAPYMTGGECDGGKLENIWKQYVSSVSSAGNGKNPLPNKCITLRDFIDSVQKLELKLGELAQSDEFQEVNAFGVLKQKTVDLSDTLIVFKNDVESKISGVEFGISKYDGSLTLLKIKSDVEATVINELRKKVIEYFGNDSDTKGLYETQVEAINQSIGQSLSSENATKLQTNNVPNTNPGIEKVSTKIKQAGLYKNDTTKVKGDIIGDSNSSQEFYYIDLAESFIKTNNDFITQIDLALDGLNKELTSIVNAAVQEQLGYIPTVRNVVAIILANMELFLHLLTDSSLKAEDIHKDQDSKTIKDQFGNDSKVYPWPTYYQKSDGNNAGVSGTDVETYPGVRSAGLGYWEEVRFVEDYISAYLELKEELELITGDVEGKPGFDGFIPLNPLESPILRINSLGGAQNLVPGPIPCSYFKDEQKEGVLNNIIERAFLVGDHTNANPLSIWKTRMGVKIDTYNPPQPLSYLNTLVTTNSGYVERDKDSGIHRVVDEKMMENYGYLDGMNCVSSIKDIIALSTIEAQLTKSGGEDEFKAELLELMKKSTKFKEKTFTQWNNDEGRGVTDNNVLTFLNHINSASGDGTSSKYSSSDTIYTYTELLVGESSTNNNVLVYPNPHTQDTCTIIDHQSFNNVKGITLEGKVGTKIKNNLSIDQGPDGFQKGFDSTFKSVFVNAEVARGSYQNSGGGSGESIFSRNQKTLIPITDKPHSKGIFMGYYTDYLTALNGIYAMGMIQFMNNDRDGDWTLFPRFTGGATSIREYPSGPYGTYDSGIYSAFIQTPLWAYNLPDNIEYHKGSVYTEGYGKVGTGVNGKHTNDDDSHLALAYLALLTQGGVYGGDPDPDRDDYEGYAGWYDGTPVNKWKSDYSAKNWWGNASTDMDAYTALPCFNITASQVVVPKGWTYLVGAVLWRMREANLIDGLPPEKPAYTTASQQDPIYWPNSSSERFKDYKGHTFRKLQPYHWPHYIETYHFADKDSNGDLGDGQDGHARFSLLNDAKNNSYVDIRKHMKSLFFMPNNIKEMFISQFKNWALNTWEKEYLGAFDPLNFGGATRLSDFYQYGDQGADVVAFNNGNDNYDWQPKSPNDNIKKMLNELLEEHHVITFTTPKAFYGIHIDDFNTEFNLTKGQFDSFVNGWIKGFQNVIKDRIKEITEGGGDADTRAKNALNDPDVKLSLYKSFKSIFDKWISRSNENGGAYEMFYNNVTNNTNKGRLLIDHFNFVDRAFNDIGSKAVVDITYLKKLADDPTASLYQVVTELLSKNNFDFFPLPSFINYSRSDTSEMKQMFEPVTDLKNIDSSPSFVCMYVGGTSTSLDIGPSSTFCGPNNKINYKYNDDGVPRISETPPEDMASGNVTAFVVAYGIENQSHFKTLNLDQAEFKETQESLMVIDQLAKGGNENNRVSKGQNLYNVYQTRSYTCTVESMGNMMIQPMMYFHLQNVPMFHGAYLITEVKHNIKPHYVTTTFKGTRVPRVIIPIVTDAYSTMVLGQTDPSKATGPASKIVPSYKGGGTTTSQGTNQGTTQLDSGGANPETLITVDQTPPKDSPKLCEIIEVMKKKKGVLNSRAIHEAGEFSSGGGLRQPKKPTKQAKFKDYKDYLISKGYYDPSKSYEIKTEPYHVNIVGIRSFTQKANSFDDFMALFYVDPNGKVECDGKKWTFYSWSITTEPGVTWLSKSEGLGTGIVAEGQYTDCYVTGKHGGNPKKPYSALHNDHPILMYRDSDKDEWAEKNTDTLYVDGTPPGVNMHTAGAQNRGKSGVNDWSAGCQVFNRATDFHNFLYICTFIAQNEKKGSSSTTLSWKIYTTQGKSLDQFIPDELKNQGYKEGASVPKRYFTYTLLNSADFGNPSAPAGLTAGNVTYENYVNSGVHSS